MDLPLDRIGAAAEAGAAAIRAAGLMPEMPEVAVAVERHRWAWKPSDVRVLLVAESHVYTSPDEIALRILRELLPEEARQTPPEYVRLVYCLGYVETWLLDRRPASVNAGTPQFWNIFGRLAGTGRQPTKGASTNAERLAWKVTTLRQLRHRGVWLLDASLHGINAPGAERVPHRLIGELRRFWWRHYGAWLFEHYPRAHRCVIGCGTATHLRELGVPVDNWIYQPQAQRSVAPERFDRGWSELLEAASQAS